MAKHMDSIHIEGASSKKQASAIAETEVNTVPEPQSQPARNPKVYRIEEVGEEASAFLQKMLKVKNVKITKVSKAGSIWEVEAEVYEENSFIKTLGLATKMQDRNYYNVTLDENLEVQSYSRGGNSEAKEK